MSPTETEEHHAPWLVNAVISNPGIDELKAKKAAAIEDEDFDEAARLKDLIDSQVSLYSLIHALI